MTEEEFITRLEAPEKEVEPNLDQSIPYVSFRELQEEILGDPEDDD